MKSYFERMTVILLALLVSAIVLSMAYFTDSNSKTNTFAVGKVDITLTESMYNLPENIRAREDIAPREKIIKDPRIRNIGVSDCFVFLEIFMPRTDRIRIDSAGQKLPVGFRDAFTFKRNTGWLQVEREIIKSPIKGEFYRYVYAYATGDKNTGKMTVLKKGDVTSALFYNDELEHRNFIEIEEKTTYEIPVYAYAVQTTDIVLTDGLHDTGKNDPLTVWNVIKAQRNSEERSGQV